MKFYSVILLLWLCPVWGGLSSGPRPWAEILKDEGRILVMLPLDEKLDNEESLQFTLPDGTNINLREIFSISGVYDLKTNTPLWTFDWGSAYKSDMVWSDDFSLMVIWSCKEFEFKRGVPLGLNFLKEGKVLKFHSEDDLYLKFSKWYFLSHKIQLGGANYMELITEGDQLIYSTPRRGSPSPMGWRDIGYWETYTFDMNTGEMLSLEIEDTKTKRIIAVILAIFALVMGSIVGLVVWLVRRAKPVKNGLGE
ncbi:hypothetical protein P0Y35_03075 [Kiritimatiellaeota bacterium B1221]|nr:hypothetical protein [Kiritimatiellaeota bacterium B1221]